MSLLSAPVRPSYIIQVPAPIAALSLGVWFSFFSGLFLQLQQIFSDTLQRAVFVALHRLKLLFHRRYKEERYWVQFPPLFHDGYYSSP